MPRAHSRRMNRSLLPLLLALATAGAAAAADQPLRIDPARSTIEVDVKATMDSFTGHLAAYDLQMRADPATGTVTATTFAFRLADLQTGKAKRDRAMLDWLGAAHPDGRFELTRLEPAASGRFRAVGQLTLHGVTRPIEFPVAVTTDRSVYALDGEATVDHREFGLPIIKLLLMVKVDPLVHVRFHLQGTLAAQP